MPLLFCAAGAVDTLDWRFVVTVSSVSAVVGGVIALTWPTLVALGPGGQHTMWRWIPVFLLASIAGTGVDGPAATSLSAFVLVAMGGLGWVVAAPWRVIIGSRVHTDQEPLECRARPT